MEATERGPRMRIQARPDDHVGARVEHRSDHLARTIGGIRVVAVYHEEHVGIDIAEHAAHDVALALDGHGNDRGACCARERSGVVAAGVVEDENCRFGQCRAEIPDHLADRLRLVVAGNKDGDAYAWTHF